MIPDLWAVRRRAWQGIHERSARTFDSRRPNVLRSPEMRAGGRTTGGTARRYGQRHSMDGSIAASTVSERLTDE